MRTKSGVCDFVGKYSSSPGKVNDVYPLKYSQSVSVQRRPEQGCGRYCYFHFFTKLLVIFKRWLNMVCQNEYSVKMNKLGLNVLTVINFKNIILSYKEEWSIQGGKILK